MPATRRSFAILIALALGCSRAPSTPPQHAATSQSVATSQPIATSQPAATSQRLAPPPDYSYRDNVPLSQEERREIEALVRQVTDEPIMSISADSDGNCDVMTGVVRGPLDGGGHTFKLLKRNGKWEMLSHGWWVS